MIPNEEEKDLYCLTVKKLSALLRGISSKHDGDFISLHCLHSFRTKNKLKFYEKVCKIKDFYETLMSSVKDNILELINI